MKVDWARMCQDSDAINIGGDPTDFLMAEYIISTKKLTPMRISWPRKTTLSSLCPRARSSDNFGTILSVAPGPELKEDDILNFHENQSGKSYYESIR
ncbi:hypothetical protein QCA50_003390 [Cerrena zonata]|uniref:Uncharacterized protein n=1 Tax=Cerrena zonata TaxID=2478898 RepID=A0AAW0GKD9_9APHY